MSGNKNIDQLIFNHVIENQQRAHTGMVWKIEPRTLIAAVADFAKARAI